MKKIKIKKKEVGSTFRLIGLEWMIVEITKKGCKCKSLESYGSNSRVDSKTNNWNKTGLRKKFNTEVYEKIAKEIGKENIIEFERDLIAVNGSKEYKKCKDKVSLMSFDERRKYIDILPKSKEWEWTLTPWGTKKTGWEYGITVVSPSGSFSSDVCLDSNGACPFCIFSSSIFES